MEDHEIALQRAFGPSQGKGALGRTRPPDIDGGYGGAQPQHNARNGLMTASRPTQINRHDATDTLSVAIPAKVRPWLCSALIGVDRLVVLSSRLRLSELISRAIQPSALR